MYKTFVFLKIKKILRNMLLINGIIFIIAFGYLFGQAVQFINIISGPVVVKISQLDTVKTEGLFKKDYIRVSGEEAGFIDANYVEIEYEKYSHEVQNKTVKGRYMAVRDADKILIVLVPPGKTGNTEFEGWLTPLGEGQGTVLKSLARTAFPEAKGAVIVPYMVDGLVYDRFEGYLLLAAVVAFAVTLWNLIRTISFWFKPEKHKVYINLWRYGNPQKAIESIEEDRYNYNSGTRFGKVSLLKSWLMAESFFNLKIIKMEQVLWIYKKETKTYHNHIPSGKEFSLEVCSSDKRVDSIKMKKKYVNEVLAAIAEQYPWIILGYTEERKAMWDIKFNDFRAYVSQKKQEAKGEI